MRKFNKIVLLDIDDTLFNTERFIKSDMSEYTLYSEVHDVLTKLAKIAVLGVFSQGDVAFQKKKLEETNILNYFLDEHMHIVDYKLHVIHEFLQTYAKTHKVYFIDDRLENLAMAKKLEPALVAIWMKRGRFAALQEAHTDFTPDATVATLGEILPLMQSL